MTAIHPKLTLDELKAASPIDVIEVHAESVKALRDAIIRCHK